MSAESEVERAFRRIGEGGGALVLKFASPGCSGVPDRVVVFPNGDVEFVELKAPGGKPRPLQRRVFGWFAARNRPVAVVSSKGMAAAWWASNQWRMR